MPDQDIGRKVHSIRNRATAGAFFTVEACGNLHAGETLDFRQERTVIRLEGNSVQHNEISPWKVGFNTKLYNNPLKQWCQVWISVYISYSQALPMLKKSCKSLYEEIQRFIAKRIQILVEFLSSPR